MRRSSVIVPIALIMLAGCSSKPDTLPLATPDATASAAVIAPVVQSKAELSDPVVQLPAVPGRPAAAYFVLTPGPQASGSVVSVAVGHFARAEFHQSKMEGGVMTMGPVDSLLLTPGKPIVFAPGGYHVMLFDGDSVLKPGDRTQITLTLDTGETIIASAKVKATGGDDMAAMNM